MSNKIPTAEEVIQQEWFKYPDAHIDIKSVAGLALLKKIIENVANTHAWNHVEAALKAAAKGARLKYPLRDNEIREDSILNAYSKDKII